MSQDPLLAIVVPAYKARFLREAIHSVTRQTDQRFRLYVCDDGSPEDLETIFRSVDLPPRAVYRRFDKNIGGHSVVASWHRSLTLTSEPWIWLFSDDDLMHPQCVAAFYAALEKDGDAFNVYRFSTLVIDSAGRVKHINAPNPEKESAQEFIYHRLTFQRMGLAPEHIFRKSAYDERGGFVDFPYALGSDDATWINLAGEDTLMRGISGPRVYWRISDINISAFTTDYFDKLSGYLAYARWLYQRPESDEPRTVDDLPAIFRMRELVKRWFLRQVHRCPYFFSPGEIHSLARRGFQMLEIPRWHVWVFLLRSNYFFIYDRLKWKLLDHLR